MEKLIQHEWRGNLRELSHTVRTMALFCDGEVILPQHVTFPPDLESEKTKSQISDTSAVSANSSGDNQSSMDLTLAGAVRRHVHFVYQQTNRNQRRTAKLLGISRATLARHLRNAAQKEANASAQQ